MCGNELGPGPKLDSLRCFVKEKWKRERESDRDEGCGNQEAAVRGPLGGMKIICSRDFFFLHSLCLNKPCQKELLL